MKKNTGYLIGALSLLLLVGATSFKTVPPPRPSASGHGTLTIPGDITRQFSFHANTMPNGSVQGSGVLTYTGGQLKVMFDIDCLSVTGNTATMSGTITRNDDNPAQVGLPCRFKVVDNGEGSNSNPDLMTLLQSGPALPNCNAPLNIALSPIEGGNIQVK